MTASNDRRTRVLDALAVENAIWLSHKLGTDAAIDYLHKKGLSSDVAERVLGGQTTRRASLTKSHEV